MAFPIFAAMSRRKLKNQVLENLEILDVAAEGKAIARHDNKVVFIPYAAPGDVVDVRVTRAKSKFLEATIVNHHSYSDVRSEPFCSHFGTCGGCKWQHLDYKSQLQFKHKQVVDQLTRIGHLELGEVAPILGSKTTKHYRNKLEYTFTATRWLTEGEIKSGDEFDRRGLGFHVPGGFDKVIDLDACYLQDPISNEIRDAIKNYAKEHDISFFHIRDQVGQLRNLIIRTSTTGDLMVILQFAGEMTPAIEGLLIHVQEKFSAITSLMYVVNNKGNETFNDLDVICFSGEPYIHEEMEGLKFKIGPKSFYQTNSIQAYELYKIAREFAELTGEELVYDLYTGTGTIANFVAKQAKKVIGIEYIEMAIDDAKANSAANNISNTDFYAGDMKDVLNTDFVNKHGQPDVIITDPPRAGMHADVVALINRIKPARVVYVSCNPATQARDLELMSEHYDVSKVQAVDMFPHTHHVENVVQLTRK